MPTAHLICGFIGSGKTTFACALEADRNAVRFTHDEWMVRLHGHNPPADKFQEYYKQVSDLIWADALAALTQGQDVILDFGFWKKADRDDARNKLAGYDHELYLVVCDEETAWSRIEARNKNLGAGHLLIERNTFDSLKQTVDRFTEDEDFIIVQSEYDPAK